MSEYFPKPKSLVANVKAELDLSNYATKTKTDYHAKIRVIKDKIASVTNLATTHVFTSVEDKVPNVCDLAKKTDSAAKSTRNAKKYFTACDHNKFMSNALDAKVTQKKLNNESDLDEKIKTSAIKKEIKTLVTTAELKAEHVKIVKLQIYDLSLFIDQSFFTQIQIFI